MKERSLTTWIMWTVLLGVVSLILNVLAVHHPQVSSINWLLDILLLVLAYLGGRDASRQGRRPAWNGALLGVIYGLLVGVAGFYQHLTLAQLKSQVKPGVSVAMMTKFVDMENATSTHLSTLLIGAIFFGLLGLIAGYIGARGVQRAMKRKSD